MSVVIAITELREQLREHGKNLRLRSVTWRITRLRSKRFVGLGTKKVRGTGFSAFCPREKLCESPVFHMNKTTFLGLSLLPNPTETLATQASVLSKSQIGRVTIYVIPALRALPGFEANYTFFPFYSLHKVAADMAIEASSIFLNDVRSAVGDDIFARFLNLKSDKSMALVIDVSGSMRGES